MTLAEGLPPVASWMYTTASAFELRPAAFTVPLTLAPAADRPLKMETAAIRPATATDTTIRFITDPPG